MLYNGRSMDDQPQYITIEEARTILKVTVRQVYRLASEQKIGVLKTGGRSLYSRADVMRIAQERGAHNASEVLARGSDNAQAKQIAALLRQQAEALARLEQRPADPVVVERLERIEGALSDLATRPAPAPPVAPAGPPPWFYAVVAAAAVVGALALLALVFLR